MGLSARIVDKRPPRLYAVAMRLPIYLLAGVGALALAGCGRPVTEAGGERASASTEPRTFAFPLVLTNQSPSAFTAVNATLTGGQGQLQMAATDADPQLMLPALQVSGAIALMLDLEAPAATRLELFYQTKQAAQFSGERIVAALLQPGRNQILLEVNDPDFNGLLRLDPGQVAGSYKIRSAVVFAGTAISATLPQRPPEDLAAAFAATTNVVYAAQTPDDLARFTPVQQVEISPDAKGAKLKSTGEDPALLLPAFKIGQPIVMKVVISSPAATVLQLFYKHSGQPEYVPAQMQSANLVPGENTIYLEVNDPEATGALRLDPGTEAGEYLLHSVEARSGG